MQQVYSEVVQRQVAVLAFGAVVIFVPAVHCAGVGYGALIEAVHPIGHGHVGQYGAVINVLNSGWIPDLCTDSYPDSTR